MLKNNTKTKQQRSMSLIIFDKKHFCDKLLSRAKASYYITCKFKNAQNNI